MKLVGKLLTGTALGVTAVVLAAPGLAMAQSGSVDRKGNMVTVVTPCANGGTFTVGNPGNSGGNNPNSGSGTFSGNTFTARAPGGARIDFNCTGGNNGFVMAPPMGGADAGAGPAASSNVAVIAAGGALLAVAAAGGVMMMRRRADVEA
ncbi:MAG: hypothetical protein H0T78_10895 [Longispora sp.]|nr:hypothetical protein [Longispora sp. (in: high G+C Gram-positive bacteria)]